MNELGTRPTRFGLTPLHALGLVLGLILAADAGASTVNRNHSRRDAFAAGSAMVAVMFAEVCPLEQHVSDAAPSEPMVAYWAGELPLKSGAVVVSHTRQVRISRIGSSQGP